MVTLVVPVRSFRAGKERLAEAMSESQRRAVALRFAAHVLDVASEAGVEAVVVTADDEVEAWAARRRRAVVKDPGAGLDAAAQIGVEWCLKKSSRWAVLHSDLPLLAPSELATVRDLIEDGRDVIAPSADGGTSLLSASRAVKFSYGPGSFSRHLALLDHPAVVTRRGLLHDVDNPSDYESLKTLRPEWTGP